MGQKTDFPWHIRHPQALAQPPAQVVGRDNEIGPPQLCRGPQAAARGNGQASGVGVVTVDHDRGGRARRALDVGQGRFLQQHVDRVNVRVVGPAIGCVPSGKTRRIHQAQAQGLSAQTQLDFDKAHRLGGLGTGVGLARKPQPLGKRIAGAQRCPQPVGKARLKPAIQPAVAGKDDRGVRPGPGALFGHLTDNISQTADAGDTGALGGNVKYLHLGRVGLLKNNGGWDQRLSSSTHYSRRS
jgi:hypothetical protein